MQKRIAFWVGVTLLIFSFHGFSSTQAQSADFSHAAYANGVSAFARGEYTRALAAFLKARADGYSNPRLGYSLGATYYRLGKYAQARQEFSRLLGDRNLGALAHYNLGLIATAEHDRKTARQEYRKAYEQAKQPRLKRLAAAALGITAPQSTSLRPFAYAKLAFGYDNNVALAPQTAAVLPVARAGSPLTTLMAGGGYPLGGTYANGYFLTGNFYNTDYQKLSPYNERMITLGAQARRRFEGWAYQAGLSGSHITIGGTAFESMASVHANAQKKLDQQNTLGVGYRYDHVSGSGIYSYLSGSQHRLFVEDRLKLSGSRLTFGYQHAINARNDYMSGAQFLSVSPTRNRLYAKLRFPETSKLVWEAAVRYEKSTYSPTDVLVSGTTTTMVDRDDTLYVARFGADYKVLPHWSVKGEYRYLNNQSNIGIYAYKSNLYLLSLNYLFY